MSSIPMIKYILFTPVFFVIVFKGCYPFNQSAAITAPYLLPPMTVRTRHFPKTSHGPAWFVNTPAQPTTKHENNLATYWDFHMKIRPEMSRRYRTGRRFGGRYLRIRPFRAFYGVNGSSVFRWHHSCLRESQAGHRSRTT